MRVARRVSTMSLALLVVVQLPAGVRAVPTTIVDYGGAHPMHIRGGQPFSYVHNIRDEPGYSPSLAIDNAELKLWFTDDRCDGPPSRLEHVTVLYDGTIWNIGEVDNSAYSACVAPSLLTDGLLWVNVSISAPGHAVRDIRLRHSTLTVCGDTPDTPPALPSPGTILLVGIGTVAVGWLRRRRTL